MPRISTRTDEALEPLLRFPSTGAEPRRASSGWLLANASAVAAVGVASAAIAAAPPEPSTRSLLFAAALVAAAGIAGGQQIKVDERTVQPAPTLVFVVCAAILLGPAAAIVVGAAAAIGTSRSPLPSLVFHLALAAMSGASVGLVAREVVAAFPALNIMFVTALAGTSGAAIWTVGESLVRAMRGMDRALRVWIVVAEGAELLVAVAFSAALVSLFDTAGVGAASVLTAALVTMFVAFRVYRGRLLRLHTEITEMSLTDPLTGVGNRRVFDERLNQELARARRTGQTVGLLLIDIDHFKEINDTHGHETGDDVLRELCERLTPRLRSEDLFARLGGDEFAAIITSITDQHDLGQIADELCQTVRESAMSDHGDELNLTVCVGGATSDWWPNADALRSAADRALYVAKLSGRDRAAVPLGEDG